MTPPPEPQTAQLAWKRFHRAGFLALCAVFLVILAGAVVRTTGSGMGCPDWPKCFGYWVPPTDESQLPADYRTRYKVQGHAIEPFNAAKTWTEYVNRLVGALAGLFVFWMVVQALRLWRHARLPLLWSAIALVLMGFQAWLGKKVVDTNLKENMITVHMVVAVIIVFQLLWAIRRHRWVRTLATSLAGTASGRRLAWAQLVVVVLSVLQLALGTQVREQIDAIAIRMDYGGREQWIAQLDVLFYVHRSFSLLLLALGLWVFWQVRKLGPSALLRRLQLKLVLLGIMIVSGVALAYLAMPAAVQPIHLLVSIILLALEFVICLNLWASSHSAPKLAHTAQP
jgi:cytochrome c oxidase assembly protein subunit 15